MRYIVYVSYRQTFQNKAEREEMTCPICGGIIPPTYSHQCEHKKPIEVEVPGEVYSCTFEKA